MAKYIISAAIPFGIMEFNVLPEQDVANVGDGDETDTADGKHLGKEARKIADTYLEKASNKGLVPDYYS